MAITQEIDLNLIPSSAPVIVHLNQYDEGKGRIIAHLYNGSQPYVPGVNATVKVQGTKPDKHAFQYWCDIDGSTVTVDVNVQMTAVAGLVPTQLIVNETSGITGSFAFQLDVQASTLPSNIDVSETDLPILTEEAQEAARRAVQAAASAEESAEEAAAWSANPPYIGENLHWFVYDTETEQFVDSGVIAEGQDGEPGNKWYKGTTISGESSTPTVFPSSGIALAYHNDFYLNATEGSIYHCETPGDASTATWVYDFKLSGGGGGVTNYNDLTNKPKIGGVELTGNKTIADLGGVQSFNGRNGSILPVAGDYKSNQIILASIMHIGGGTQDDVQEALEALNDKDAGGSTITVTTAEVTLRGKNVTLSDGVNTWTKQFDNAGKAIFTSIMSTGALSVTASDGTETARASLTVPYFGNYDKAIAFWTATIAVTTTTTQFNGLTVSAKKSGAVMGTATFSNGSATITVPEQGTYTLEVTLDWKTYTSSPFSVTEETTYNETIDGFIAPISLTTPTSEFYGQSISVTRNGVAVPVSLAFSNSGTASFTALDEGTYLFTLTYGGEPYTASVVVSAETTYSAVIKMWTATINVTTASSQLQSQDIDVYKGSAKVATIAFNASGQASYLAHESGTYHFVCTVDGYPFTSADVVVSDETVYSTSITYFGATLNISTSSSDLYSQTITIKKGSTVVGTTAFSAQGSASYTVHETGTYTCECEGYSGSATVSAETTYNVTINTVETYHLTVDIYSAASDTLSYTDDNGAQTVTTDATGKATGVSITITEQTPGTASITFTSSVAKKPDNLSNDYSKSVTLTSSTTAIYVMPDNALYWWGYESPDLEDMTTANGWSYSALTLTAPTHNTQSISFSGSASSFRGIASKTPKQVNSVSAIADCITADGGIYGWVAASNNKNLNAITNDDGTFAASGTQYINHVITLMDSGYVTLRTGKARNITAYALWFE